MKTLGKTKQNMNIKKGEKPGNHLSIHSSYTTAKNNLLKNIIHHACMIAHKGYTSSMH